MCCAECGCCSGGLGQGWSAWLCQDPDEIDGPSVVVYCPPCAAKAFGYRPELAANYVCAWDPVQPESAESSSRP